MCGIFCCVKDSSICSTKYVKQLVSNVSKLLNHRGPDNMSYKLIKCPNNKTLIMLHTRLHIVGDATPQPLVSDDGNIILIINGEIFNWKELEIDLNYKCVKSDCEIIIPLYEKYIKHDKKDFSTFFNKINGQFSFVLYDVTNNYLFVSRDHIGITPLYCGYDENSVAFSSELKCLSMRDEFNVGNEDFECYKSLISNIKVFYPRSYLYTNIEDCVDDIRLKRFKEYLNYYDSLNWTNNIDLSYEDLKVKLKDELEKSINLQLRDLLNDNSPEFGVLLSGGLDSSLVASIISKNSSLKKIKTFSIGMTPDSTDLIAARKVAKFLGTDHYEFYFTVNEGLNSIKDVIWYTETYDTTTVRASTAMYLLTKKVKEKFPNIKVVFSGELSDEMMSYLYGGNAPSEQDFQLECIKLVSDVHMFDSLRANKTCMANSIEVRVPFTDPNFVRYMLSVPVKYKIFGKLNNYKTMEKQILRDSFNIKDNNGKEYLPNDILYRKKEAFSDGVSNHERSKDNWIDNIIRYCDNKYKDVTFSSIQKNIFYNRPITKEQLYYRQLFRELFNRNIYRNTSEFTVHFWKPKWCGESVDPSARKHIKEQFV
jgi:asparagine synthase (glutamine-hydrolysing)